MVRAYVVTDTEKTLIAEEGRPGYEIAAATRTMEVNTVSAAHIELPETNHYANALRQNRNVDIEIYSGRQRVFYGSIASVKSVFLGTLSINLDSPLGWLRDIQKPPFEVTAGANKDVSVYLAELIQYYNNQVAQRRRLSLSGVNVDGKVIVDHTGDYNSCLDLFAEQVKARGGYVYENFAVEGENPQITYLAEPISSGQVWEFGKGFLELTDELDFSNYASRVYAIGQNGIALPSPGYVVDANIEAMYGRRDYAFVSGDAELQLTLLAQANRELAERKLPFSSVEVNAPGGNIILGTSVEIRDNHQLQNPVLVCTKLFTDYMDNSQSKATFGKPRPGLIKQVANMKKG